MEDAECAESKDKSCFRFLGFELWWKFIKDCQFFSTKMTISQKLKIAKIWKLILHLFQHIPHLLYKFDHFWKKNVVHEFIKSAKIKMVGGFAFPPELHPWSLHALGLRTLVSLVSVNGKFRKKSLQLFDSHALKSHFFSEVVKFT